MGPERYNSEIPAIKRSISLGSGLKLGNVQSKSCIYCTSKDDLTNEHPIPLGLWGKFQIMSGSCKKCAAETSKLELNILRDCLGQAREFLGSPSRRARKKGVRTGLTEVTNDAGHKTEVPVSSMTQFVLMPIFDYPPRRLFGDLRAKKHRNHQAKVAFLTKNQDQKLFGYWGKPTQINNKNWARFLVKVAYGEYIRSVDLDFRSAELSNFILTGNGDCTKYIGGQAEAPPIRQLHNITFAAIQRNDNSYAIICYIRMFAFLKTPPYLIHLMDLKNGAPLPQGILSFKPRSRSDIWPNYPDSSYYDHHHDLDDMMYRDLGI